jgi:uncharacterized protein YbjT (DUF2867 family)
MSAKFLVTGATGYQGGSLARTLISQGSIVHALIRDPSSDKARALEKLGVVVFKGGFDDVDVIKSAIKGVSGVFLNPFPTPMDPDHQIRQAKNVIDAAVAEKVHLVLSTAFATAQKEKWTGSGPKDFLYLYYSRKFNIEAEVRAAALKSYTIIRPAYLMHNYLLPFSLFHYPEFSKSGVLKEMYHQGRKISHLDSADVGKIAAVVLSNPEKYNKLEMDIGAENLDGDDAVRIIKEVSGREDLRTEKVIISNEDFDAQTKTGLTWHYFANTQDVGLETGKEVQDLFGVKLTSFAEYLNREKALLQKSLPPLAN